MISPARRSAHDQPKVAFEGEAEEHVEGGDSVDDVTRPSVVKTRPRSTDKAPPNRPARRPDNPSRRGAVLLSVAPTCDAERGSRAHQHPIWHWTGPR